MHFPSKISIALVASLAAVGEASHALHARSGKLLHARGFNHTTVVTSAIMVVPTPLEKTPAVTPAVPLSTAAADQTDSGAPTATEDVTLTYTLGTGTSTTVVTTTVHRTATNTHVVVQTPEAVAEDDLTTTISSTSTTTSLVTVYPASAASSAGGSCNGQATVTVTEKETVTMTPTPISADPSSAAVVSGAIVTAPEANKQVAEPTTAAAAVPSSPGGPAVPAGAPYGNGTLPITHKAPAPSGFLTSKIPLPSGFARRM